VGDTNYGQRLFSTGRGEKQDGSPAEPGIEGEPAHRNGRISKAAQRNLFWPRSGRNVAGTPTAEG